jgi:hypothetical protein
VSADVVPQHLIDVETAGLRLPFLPGLSLNTMGANYVRPMLRATIGRRLV